MTPIQKRFTMFLLGCIATRLGLSYLINRLNTDENYYMNIVKIIVIGFLTIASIGFITIFINGWRKVGQETQGNPIWWNSLRPIHSILYGISAFYLYQGNNKIASKIIFADTIFGLLSFIIYHYSQNNIIKVFE